MNNGLDNKIFNERVVPTLMDKDIGELNIKANIIDELYGSYVKQFYEKCVLELVKDHELISLDK